MQKKVREIRELIHNNRGASVGILMSLVIAVVIIYCGIWSYRQYRQELIRTEQEQLLTMAETVGTSLVNYVEQEIGNLDLYFSLLERQDQSGESDEPGQSARFFMENSGGLYDAVACYDGQGRLVFQDGSMNYGYQWVSEEKTATICGKRIVGDHYEMFLSRKFLWDGELYTAVYAMNLNGLYTRIVEPVKIGEGGYSVVKDSDLSIIMHHAPGQIGMDAVYDRSKKYPQLDLTDLFQWIHTQQVQPEGVGVIRSYMWDDPELTPEERIVAYTSIHLPGETWIVNSTLPFKELNGPLNRMLLRLIGISSLFFLTAVTFVFMMTRSLMRSEGQKKEIDYLRRINEGMELLCRKEEEIQHYQRVQSIGQMSSHIAHEFNNYLTPVMLYGGMLESDASISQENREMIQEILNAAGRAADLSRKLLDFSRQDTGAALTVINLTEEVKKAVHIVRQLTPQNIAFISEVEEQPLYVRGKAGMAEHILMNLCNNAYHAMDGKTGTLTVWFGRSPEGQVLLSVSDTGCGISEAAREKIFEPFYTTKRSGKGTGLGLSVIRNLMVAAGGEIQVDSKQGEGTTFRLYFPEAVPEAESKKTGSDGAPAHRQGSILVVDDDPDLLKILETVLKQKKWKVECFSHPAAALSKLQNHKDCCDVILTDFSMPAMNGLELAAVVRRLNPDIRLVLMSGQEEESFDWYLKNRFIDAFVLKSDLKEKLDSVL